jgi:hypothetical protein
MLRGSFFIYIPKSQLLHLTKRVKATVAPC